MPVHMIPEANNRAAYFNGAWDWAVWGWGPVAGYCNHQVSLFD